MIIPFATLLVVASCLWVYDAFYCVLFGLVFFASLDVHLLWRKPLVYYFCKMRRKKSPKKFLESNVFKVICLPTDIDTALEMTTNQLVRECTTGHLEFWLENFVYDAVKALGGKLRVEGYQISYRQPIKLFQTFQIVARVVGWDDNGIYMEQRIVRNKDKTECACVMTCHRVDGVTMANVLEVVGKRCEQTFKQPQHSLVDKFKDIHKELSKSN